MTIKLEFNPSTALLHFTADTKKVQVTTGPFGPRDYCCFLDPDPAIWSSVVTYDKDDEAAFVAGSFVYRSLISNNLNNDLNDSASWLESTEVSCDSVGWDSYPPYGGVGLTPLEYEMTITDIPAIDLGGLGILIPAVVNGTHTLNSLSIPDIIIEGFTGVISNATTTGEDLEILVRIEPGTRNVQMPGVFGFLIDPCEIFGSHIVTDEPTDYTVEWNPK